MDVRAQQALQTLSGQNILLYSDGSWEYKENLDQNENSPFEKPVLPKSKERATSVKLTSYLKKEEVERMIVYLRSKNAEESRTNLEIYQSVSNDLTLIRSANPETTEGIQDIQALETKYLDKLKAIKEVSYELPLATGKSLKTDDDCELFNGIDQHTGEKIVWSNKTELLTYTPKKLLNYYKDKIYLSIQNSIVEQDGDYYLDFELIFNSKDIKKGYGTIPTDGFVRINMIKGPGIFLEITRLSEAKIEKYTGRTIYPLKCKIKNKDDLRRLKKQYVDDLGIMWSTGFEAYPIYDVGFFKEKFKCFESKK